MSIEVDANTLYLIYDDECPLCRHSAKAVRIKQAVGNLELLNARESHPLIDAAHDNGLDPDVGIIVYYHNQFYFAEHAISLLAQLSEPKSRFNLFFTNLLKKLWIAKCLYPIVKGIRRFFLYLKGVHGIKPIQGVPIFQQVLTPNQWQALPVVLKKKLNLRPYSHEKLNIKGVMSIKSSRYMNCLKPVLALTGVPYPPEGNEIAVSVTYYSQPNSNLYGFQRDFGTKPPLAICSAMFPTNQSYVFESIRFGLGLRLALSVEVNQLNMHYKGFGIRLFGIFFRLPLGLLLGRCDLKESAIDDEHFSLAMELRHWAFGKIYEYSGTFSLFYPPCNEQRDENAK